MIELYLSIHLPRNENNSQLDNMNNEKLSPYVWPLGGDGIGINGDCDGDGSGWASKREVDVLVTFIDELNRE